jgi:hypothetical protein
MLTSYPVACPHANCGWTGSLMPSLLRGGADAEIASMHRAWFRCPRCQGDWEVRITDDRVRVLPAAERSITIRDSVASTPGRAVAFDLDAASLISLREALPGWEVEVVNGATAASLSRDWNPGAANLLVVKAQEEAAETLGLCRFLASCSGYSRDSQQEVAGILGPHRNGQNQEMRVDAPLLVLVPPGQETLVGAALEAGAHSCLMLPIHAKDVASMLIHACAGNQPGRHTLNREGAQTEDRWRDDGGQG